MRKLVILAVLGLAACNENAGWNPNYTMNATPYGDYQRARETALMTNGQAPLIIPVEPPAKSPTPDEITGRVRTAPAAAGAVVVQPGQRVTRPAVPASAKGRINQPLLEKYARTEKQPVGTAKYRRSAVTARANERAQAACAYYANPAIAQTVFLEQGGPLVDTLMLDPDGDGYVCGWNPGSVRDLPL